MPFVSDVARQHLNWEEYLAFEAAAPEGEGVRYEFVGGEVFAMTGGSLRHNVATLNLAASLLPDARAKGCRLYIADVKLRIGENAYYPDVMAVCGTAPPSDQFETAPCLLVEVLSPSTRSVDRREKLDVYLRLPSLQHYVLVEPDAMFIDVHTRIEDKWTVARFMPGAHFSLSCPGSLVIVEDVFRDLF